MHFIQALFAPGFLLCEQTRQRDGESRQVNDCGQCPGPVTFKFCGSSASSGEHIKPLRLVTESSCDSLQNGRPFILFLPLFPRL